MISGQNNEERKTVVLRWQGDNQIPGTYLKLADNVLVTCAYLSPEPIRFLPNKIQVTVSTQILSEAILNDFGYTYKDQEFKELISKNLKPFIEALPDDCNRIYVAIPLFSNFWSGKKKCKMPQNVILDVLKSLYGSLFILGPSDETYDFVKTHCVGLDAATIEFYINNIKVDKPCSICCNRDDYDEELNLCLYQTPGYMCLLNNALDAELKTSIEINTKLSMFSDTDVAYMDAIYEAVDINDADKDTDTVEENIYDSLHEGGTEA